MTNTQKAPELLAKAAAHMADRAATYDKPEGERSMGKTIAIFNLYHGTNLTEAQGWHLMQILKDVRLFQRAGYHADSAEDCIAYAALKAEAKAGETTSGLVNGSDGWIKWGGGEECPVHPDTVVEVALRLDAKKLTSHAWKLNWEHRWWEDDVMAYRVVAEASKPLDANKEELTDGDWVSWFGGPCPVAPTTMVDVIFREHGQTYCQASRLNWGHFGNVEDIIAYRVAKTKPNHTNHERYGQCSACKHCYVNEIKDPCKSCLASEETLSNWEPAEDKE